jgi:hypothetical protein
MRTKTSEEQFTRDERDRLASDNERLSRGEKA